MQKLLILILVAPILIVTGCSRWVPGSHKIPIQQGNVLEQDELNKLKPGMSRRQVQFVMGSPLVEDPFRTDRWDYYYSTGVSGKVREQKRVTLYFEQDRLARIEGDMRPQEVDPAAVDDTTQVVDVEGGGAKKPGFFRRMLQKIGIGDD